jgi:phosphoheptose isomerase
MCTFFNKKCNVTKPIMNNITESTVNNVTEQKIEPYKYTIEGTTHVIRIDPRNLWAVETQCPTNKVPYNNFVNSIYFMPQANGKMYPLGIMVNAGKVISNYATHGKPVSTLIIKDMNNIYMKKVTDITQEGDVWFAVSGYGIYPDITYVEEGFTKVIENGIAKDYSDVARVANRPIIGYSSKEKKIIIAVRAGSNAQRAAQTAKNLGMDFAISLDGGGSTTLKINNSYKFRGDGRSIFGGLTWN